MREAVPVAFYAPLKSPHHPSPSGDRTMARLLLKGLAAAGFAPLLASEMRTFDGRGDGLVQERLRTECAAEADRLIAAYRDGPAGRRPRLWFTYHVYYKAPDWIGPRVADALRIPYAIAEGSRAGKRAEGAWQLGHAGAEAALDRADAIFVMTEADKPALARARPATQRLVDLPPFIDSDDWPPLAPRHEERAGLRFLTVAMMRPGDKLASYRILAAALGRLADADWTLGDRRRRRCPPRGRASLRTVRPTRRVPRAGRRPRPPRRVVRGGRPAPVAGGERGLRPRPARGAGVRLPGRRRRLWRGGERRPRRRDRNPHPARRRHGVRGCRRGPHRPIRAAGTLSPPRRAGSSPRSAACGRPPSG